MIHSRFSHRIVYWKFKLSRIKEYGLLGVFYRLIKKSVSLLLALLLLPFSVLLYILQFKRVCIFTERIGHLAIEPDTLLKAQYLHLVKEKKWIILAPYHLTANSHLLKYWQPYFTIIQSNFFCYILNSIFYWSFMRFDVSHFINKDNHAQYAYYVNKLWGNKNPILSLTPEDEAWGREMLHRLGVPKNAWFVCVHAREGGYSPKDEMLHAHRNGKIENLIPAIHEITQRGGWVIRLGDPSQTPLNKIEKCIDYAHHPLRSARLDIILCAKAKFILGNTSGIFLVGTIFGVPSALANMIPMGTLGLYPKDISIPKLYEDPTENAYISFPKVMASDVSLFRSAPLYKAQSWKIIENSAEDILLLCQEMLNQLSNTFNVTKTLQDYQKNYMKLFNKMHYSYHAASTVSFLFLEKYKNLLNGV